MGIFATVVLCIVTLSAPGWAHGGQYKGPGDAGSNTGGSGGTVRPGDSPGGGMKPGPGRPGGRQGGVPDAGGTTGRGTPLRGGGDKQGSTGGWESSGPGYDVWEFWWEHNKDAFLALKQRMTLERPSSGINVLTRRGRHESRTASRRPHLQRVVDDVIPDFIELLGSSEDRDILDSTVLALGRIGRAGSVNVILPAVLPLLRHDELTVRGAATLALGVLGSEDAVETLQQLAGDSSAGRTAVGQSRVSNRVRAFAALSLGLIDTPDVVDSLAALVDDLSDAEKDVKVCALLALGLVQGEGAAPAQQYLVRKLADRSLDQTVRSYIPTSLGKLATPGERVLIEPLMETFEERDTENLVRQSVAIALGRMCSMADADVVDSLMDYVREGRDAQTRHFAFISLAKIGARDEQPELRERAHARLVDLLMRELDSGKASRKTHRSWAALAAALYGRSQAREAARIMESVQVAYEREKDPSYKSAAAIALGLLGVRDAGEALTGDFLDSRDQDFRGYCAVGLGLMDYQPASAHLRSQLPDKTITPTFRLQVATALGLMGDVETIDILVETLRSAQTLGVSSAVARALGLIGDRSAVDPLQGLARDEDKAELNRAFACVALGIVCEKTDLPWNARISEDNNYRARVPAVDEVLDIL